MSYISKNREALLNDRKDLLEKFETVIEFISNKLELKTIIDDLEKNHTKEMEYINIEIEEMKDERDDFEDEKNDLDDENDALKTKIDDLEYELTSFRSGGSLDDEMKSELLVIASKKYSITELETRLGGNVHQLI